MSKQEFATLVLAMQAMYVDEFIGTEEAMDVWFALLYDLDYQILSKTLQKMQKAEISLLHFSSQENFRCFYMCFYFFLKFIVNFYNFFYFCSLFDKLIKNAIIKLFK